VDEIYVKKEYPRDCGGACGECFREWAFNPQRYQEEQRWHSICSPLHGLNINKKIVCFIVTKKLMYIRLTHQCRDCIEEYLVQENNFVIEENRNKNFETKVITRY